MLKRRHRNPNRISNFLYWLRCQTLTRYHWLDLRSKEHDYQWGFRDADTQILLACFNILKNFVEREKPFPAEPGQEIDESYEDGWRQAYQEMKELYDWWMSGRSVEQAQFYTDYDNFRSQLSGKPTWKDLAPWREREVALDKRDEDQLIRLIKLRPFLWT